MKKIGHDLGGAIANGFKDIFQDAESLWCTQHAHDRHSHKLKKLGCKDRTKGSIMADIYDVHIGLLLQSSLADAGDEKDFFVKLGSLKPVWDKNTRMCLAFMIG